MVAELGVSRACPGSEELEQVGFPGLLCNWQCIDLSENQSLSIFFGAQEWIYKTTLARRN